MTLRSLLSKTRAESALVALVFALSSTGAHAEDAPAPAPKAQAAKTPATKPGAEGATDKTTKGKPAAPDKRSGTAPRPRPLDETQRRASEAVVGYYKALIAKDYDQAGSFTHPDFVAPLQVGLATEVEKSPNANAQKGTLEQFGVADVTALKAMPAGQFFARFARSQYGTTLQALSDPALDAKVSTDRIICNTTKTACDVEIVISVVDGKSKERTDRRSSVRTQLSDGRWLVGMRPPPPKPPPPPMPEGGVPGH